MTKNILTIPLLLLVFHSCKKEKKIDEIESFDKAKMLEFYAEDIIIPRYNELENNISSLSSSMTAFSSSSTLSNFENLRAAFDSTYLTWQSVSFIDFGPAKSNTLKSVFNIFPVDTIQIENNIANGSYVLGSASNIDAIGLPALDYLLHKKPNATQALAEFKNADSTERKQYVQAVINQLSATLSSVVTSWNSNYKNTFIKSDGNGQGSSLSEIVNALNLDFEKFIRDGKIGVPLGVRSLGTPLPLKSEAYFSSLSKELASKSISSFQSYFNGKNGIGLDDYLNHLDAKHGSSLLSDKINGQFTSILNKIDQLSGPLSQEVLVNQSKVQEVYDEMQKMVVLLKVDLSSALSVLITYQDNDGD